MKRMYETGKDANGKITWKGKKVGHRTYTNKRHPNSKNATKK